MDKLPDFYFSKCGNCGGRAVLGAISMMFLASESGTMEGEQFEIPTRLPVAICIRCKRVGVSTPKSTHDGETVEADGWNLPKLGKDMLREVFGIAAEPCEDCFGEDPTPITPMIEGRVN
jgi:hypothetical protein